MSCLKDTRSINLYFSRFTLIQTLTVGAKACALPGLGSCKQNHTGQCDSSRSQLEPRTIKDVLKKAVHKAFNAQAPAALAAGSTSTYSLLQLAQR
jgi:hypothetical protein